MKKKKWHQKVWVLIVIALTIVVFVAICLSYLRIKSKKIESAKIEASKVLNKVEKCETAVTVGTSLDDLKDKADKAQSEVRVFARSENGNALPEFTQYLQDAVEHYVDSCGTWFNDNESAEKKYDEAVDRWTKSPSAKPMPELKDYQDDSGYQDLWVEAQEDLESARSTFNNY